MRQRTTTRHQLRERIASEAARIMIEGGIKDFQKAKRKALLRLRVAPGRQMPGNDEIEQAMIEYQRLFRAHCQPLRLEKMRATACSAMRFLSRFEPGLVGAVLRGTADEHSEVCLHVFSEPAEAVGLYLAECGIPYEPGERRLRVSASGYRIYPAYRFIADDVPVELVVFDVDGQRQAPLSPIDGKPMGRARLEEVEGLV